MSLPGAAVALAGLTALEALDAGWLGAEVSDEHETAVQQRLLVRSTAQFVFISLFPLAHHCQ